MTPTVTGQAGLAVVAPASPPTEEAEALRAVARELEASFLAEMLKHAGFGEGRDSFGGGVGEEQFVSLLRDEHARALTDRGGIGLAEALFRALVARSSAADGAQS
ncbi:rod-binding protein [Roseicyclus mahoneyensis]|uniref:Rod binding protein n=1 Tax=Roseicyclus mahoneyensis TaxID=164332 RepID=A0A316GFM0_9RHOB|nr:rod-binding protein [Roseicyclus mahoneyensis]PWK59787.1 rod binding protein [Roseicyclus mahoneyensis]